jgi:CheY-like chemotaxis protein
MKVMLVDDDRTMRTILRTLLELESYNVAAWDGLPSSDIIAQIRQEKPDIVLLDVHLREIDGFDILRGIREDQELSAMCILMTSGMDVQDKCMRSGANGFLLKPYMPDDLIQQLRSLAGNKI